MAVTRMGEQPERRARYRFTQTRETGLSVALVVDGVLVPVTLVDTNFAGAGLATPASVELQVEQVVVLSFKAADLALPVTVRATVRSRTPHGDRVRYGVEFHSPGTLSQRLPGRLVGMFNRRRAFRIAPESSKPIEAQILRETGGVRLNLPIICLSVSGAALFAKRVEDQLLMAGDTIHITFRVPDTPNVCVIAGTVRYGSKQRGGFRYGVEFDPDKTPMFARQQRVLTRYVMEQQRRMLDTE